jgi:hypothetical protein
MDPFTGRRGEWREMVFFGPISCLLLESQLSVVIRGGERSDVGGMESERAGGREWEWGGEGTHGSSETSPVRIMDFINNPN